MLTQDQLAVIGEIAITFNDLEYLVDTYLLWFLEPHPDYAHTAAQLIIENLPQIDRKLALLKELSSLYALKKPELKPIVEELNAAIKEANKVRNHRNDIVHAQFSPTDPGKGVTLVRRKRVINADLVELQHLATRSSKVADDLNLCCARLYARLSGL